MPLTLRLITALCLSILLANVASTNAVSSGEDKHKLVNNSTMVDNAIGDPEMVASVVHT
ncbi:hypothetical protein M8C21_015920 [Ambrosia artemisiifolia]|uniref:RxLR effector protein n=1 Tax=Ambrosia artemisiifolia TaxID=4212 RepID=A0AAD5D852_AMBAR|nr:hypothetical protein M8C21_015920 [Ambrosia artemisiifolia]